MRPIVRLRPLAALLACLAAASLAPRDAHAQALGSGSVRGRAFAAADRAPVAYALIRLTPVGGGTGRTALTDQQGDFAFAAVTPGTYRLSLERIGYQSEATEPFTVAADQVVERTLASRPTAIALAPLMATSECRTSRDLDRNPRLAALWNETRKALETTLAFTEGYYYSYELRQYWSTNADDAPLDSLVRRVVNDPRAPRENRDRRGWGRSGPLTLQLEIPDGSEILDPAFLTTHCLEGDAAQSGDALEFGFRPVRNRGGRIDIRGVVRVDAHTLQMKEIELEYLDEGRAFLQGTVVYQDAVVPGGIVRMPVGMTFTGGPPRAVLLRPVRGQVQYVNYSGLMKVEPAPPPAPARH